MDDKCLLENILQLTKGSSDLYLHGTIESSTENVHQAFHDLLCETLKIQHEIYKKMEAKGWYPAEQAEQQKIQQTKQKYSMQ
ncbi:spore coat protein [Clostridium nigeriense]|uniref:spore coat protein n=1 Tax=Clostridium nigeriense TaxID=1805470 RepID=UPI00082B2BE2|nr:spore coat protein [Clostridium nigeriense]